MSWRSTEHRTKAIKWIACLPVRVWRLLEDDPESVIWAIDDWDKGFVTEVWRMRSGYEGPTYSQVVEYLSRQVTDADDLK